METPFEFINNVLKIPKYTRMHNFIQPNWNETKMKQEYYISNSYCSGMDETHKCRYLVASSNNM